MRQVIPSGGQAMPSEGGCPRARAEGRVRMCDSGRVVSSHCLGFFSGSLCAHARLITAFNSRDALLSPSKELVSMSASKQCPGHKSAPSQAGRAPPGLWTPASACPEPEPAVSWTSVPSQSRGAFSKTLGHSVSAAWTFVPPAAVRVGQCPG